MLQSEECGPWAAYVDDAAGMEAQLKSLLPSLQHVIADITHVMRRFSETLAPKHYKTGEPAAMRHLVVAADWQVVSL